ncbi:MAG: ATP-dependent RecD-like DNA helicase [Herbinix sp.]|nr:ATP-dependent RecD-like DNA helicase [Herbinix sp.]
MNTEVKKYISNIDKSCDILILDECSTISNEDMKEIITYSNFKLIIMAGDPYQIESITFGNWFEILINFVPKKTYVFLEDTRRTENEELINLWDKVRRYDDNVQEYLAKGKYCYNIDKNILEKNDENEIILCLNYDGLYGINNVNRLIQQKNKNDSYFIGVNEYKIGDPILFNENSEKYEPLLFNNAKGIISNIIRKDEEYKFYIELDKSINELDLVDGVSLVGISSNKNSIIEIIIRGRTSSDNDNSEASIPFNISYAVSIHKSQGLEYDSVKIIIVDEIEEMITHNIFYTAITRTKNKLKIYWSPNTQQNILSSFTSGKNNKDAYIIASKHGFKFISQNP